MKHSPRLTQGFTRTLNPKLERFIGVNPTAVGLIRKQPSLGPQNGKWLKRASFIVAAPHLFPFAVADSSASETTSPKSDQPVFHVLMISITAFEVVVGCSSSSSSISSSSSSSSTSSSTSSSSSSSSSSRNAWSVLYCHLFPFAVAVSSASETTSPKSETSRASFGIGSRSSCSSSVKPPSVNQAEFLICETGRTY